MGADRKQQGVRVKMVDGMPRRIRTDLASPAEKAIREAMWQVELAGAHPRLTDAVILLQQALDATADFVDLGDVPASPPATGKEPVNGLKPCPFCGKDAELRVVGHRLREWIVRCPAEQDDSPCPVAPMSRHQPTEAGAIAAWNQRVPASPREKGPLLICRVAGCENEAELGYTACGSCLHTETMARVRAISAPVASGTPKPCEPCGGTGEREGAEFLADDVLCRACDGTGRIPPVSPAPAAPGVDYLKWWMSEDGPETHLKSRGFTDEQCANVRKALRYPVTEQLDADYRALIDAARAEERRKMVNEAQWRHIEGLDADHAEERAGRDKRILAIIREYQRSILAREAEYAPLLELVAEWQAAKKAEWDERDSEDDSPEALDRLNAATNRRYVAEAALAAWRKP